MTFDFTSPESDRFARIATNAAGYIQDHMEKPLKSPWVSLAVWLVLAIIVMISTSAFVFIGESADWPVEQLAGAFEFGIGLIGLIIIGTVYDARMVLACMGWNLLSTMILAILAAG